MRRRSLLVLAPLLATRPARAAEIRVLSAGAVEPVHASSLHQTIQPVDLVVDPYARLLFWTCNQSNSINVTRIIAKPISMGAVHHSHADQPRHLAYHYRTK